MKKTKSSLYKHLQMLRVFASAYLYMNKTGRKSLYEAHLLMHDENGIHYKVFRYFIGSSILPDSISSECDDVYITLMKPSEINHYLQECVKYGIKSEESVPNDRNNL